jgi:serine phosphatase RsbU (regulator of sigma subunit)
MKLRTQLILAFVLLAVVPLTGMTVFSYVTSIRAFRKAVEVEATALAEDMGGRMEAVTADLSRRIEKVGELPLAGEWADEAKPGDVPPEGLMAQVEDAMGEAASYLESLELVAEPPAPASSPPAVVVAPVPETGGGRRWRVEPPPGAPGTPAPPQGAADAARAARAEAFGEQVREKMEKAARDLEARLRGAGSEAARRELGRDAAAAASRMAGEIAGFAASEAVASSREGMKKLLGRDFEFAIRRHGAPVGRLQARVRSGQVLGSVLARTRRHRGEIPFAVDSQGEVYAPAPEDVEKVRALAVTPQAGGPSIRERGDWVVVTRRDPETGLTLGIARPVGDALKEIRRTAALNLAAGLGLVGLALLGTLPVSARLTRNLASLSAGVERLAAGDLEARVPVRSRDEVGRLTERFNKMAEDLRAHQQQLIGQERLRKELEISRRIQEELLPREPLRFEFAEVKGISIPAREVGGDFFDYLVLDGGDLALLVGDVSGKGVPAALLMANLQARLRARLPLERDLAALATHLDEETFATTPPESYLTLFMAIADVAGRVLRYVNAGHNTQFLRSARGELHRLESTGRPLGLYPGGGYEERSVALQEGDCLFLFTDGLVEAENEAGEPFGDERLPELLAGADVDEIIARVEAAVRAHRGRAEPADDATLLVLKVGAPPRAG